MLRHGQGALLRRAGWRAGVGSPASAALRRRRRRAHHGRQAEQCHGRRLWALARHFGRPRRLLAVPGGLRRREKPVVVQFELHIDRGVLNLCASCRVRGQVMRVRVKAAT
jgi:hypothetical protein